LIRATTGLACVIGDPIAHSRSPALQNAALAEAGIDAVYVAFHVPPSALEAAVRGLASLGAVGSNITLPHKEAAALLCDSLSAEAAAAGAVNTLVFREGAIAGHLTDGLGMLDALRDHGVEPAGRPALVLGAGGSARAAAAALLVAGAGPVRVLARRLEAAEELAASLAGLGAIEAVAAVPQGPLGIVAHCTPVGALVELEASPLPADALERMDIACDFAYRPDGTPTPLVASGRPAIDGLELLVRQGARAFELFFGRPASLDAMRRAARAT
jgi:shikimate dehydrogenase